MLIAYEFFEHDIEMYNCYSVKVFYLLVDGGVITTNTCVDVPDSDEIGFYFYFLF